MRKGFFYVLLLILGGIALLCDIAFTIYLGITISSVLKGLAFMPQVFPSLCIGLIVVNSVSIAYSILYITLLRK